MVRDRADALCRVCPRDPGAKGETHRVSPRRLWPLLFLLSRALLRRRGDREAYRLRTVSDKGGAHAPRPSYNPICRAVGARPREVRPFRCRHSHVSQSPQKTAPHGACRQEQGQCRDAPRRHTGGVRVQPTLYIRLRGAESYRVVGDRKVRNRRRSRFLRSRSRPVAAWSPLQEVPPGLYRDR